jgi:hypothetical protein
MTSSKHPAANRHHGGPGSSHQREDLPDPTLNPKVSPSDLHSHQGKHSRVSGGGGEPDSHHTHNDRLKGET